MSESTAINETNTTRVASEEDILDTTTTPASPIGTVNPHYNQDNERLDCDNIDDMLLTRIPWLEQPSFVTVLMRFFGNMFVDVFKAIFS